LEEYLSIYQAFTNITLSTTHKYILLFYIKFYIILKSSKFKDRKILQERKGDDAGLESPMGRIKWN
jgi:hypothetical protein